jgi:SAM-dependent methyltransferase
MRREQSNRIRFLIEELLPPIIRDTSLFKLGASLVWGSHIEALAKFRKSAAFVGEAEYTELYRTHPRLHEDTDNSLACQQRIAADVRGPDVCDIGCGTGYLLRYIRATSSQDFTRMVGLDIVEPSTGAGGDIEFVQGAVEKLPFQDREFDTVVCTHVIEHILNYRQAIEELRRVARHRLIIVVPRERESIYTFNPHLNFFPYSHSFLRAMIPVPKTFTCGYIGRDIYYMEERESPAGLPH